MTISCNEQSYTFLRHPPKTTIPHNLEVLKKTKQKETKKLAIPRCRALHPKLQSHAAERSTLTEIPRFGLQSAILLPCVCVLLREMTSTSVSAAEAFLKNAAAVAAARLGSALLHGEGKMWTGGQKRSNHKLPLQKRNVSPHIPHTPVALALYREPGQKCAHTHTHIQIHMAALLHTHK